MVSKITTFFMMLSLALVAYILFTKTSKKPKKIKIKRGDYQISFIINKDLGMSKGKILSQFGHAIDSMHEKLVDYPELVEVWRNCGSAKITLKGTQDEINKIYYDAKQLNLPYVRIFDAGRTQVKPGSNTIIAVGPATKEDLEPITGHLSLY